MNIALIGYGKMGHEIEKIAVCRKHAIVCTIDNDNEWAEKERLLEKCDVAIEFSTPATAVANIRRCLEHGLATVCGTTGWYDEYESIATLCEILGGALFTATNFSIGMNIMFALNKRLAELMRGHDEYSIEISETHHIHKLDAPSGTAITLRNGIMEILDKEKPDIPIESIREGEIAGIHTVRYNSTADTISITHEAHSRQGLAMGAVLATEYLNGKKGIFGMKDLLNF